MGLNRGDKAIWNDFTDLHNRCNTELSIRGLATITIPSQPTLMVPSTFSNLKTGIDRLKTKVTTITSISLPTTGTPISADFIKSYEDAIGEAENIIEHSFLANAYWREWLNPYGSIYQGMLDGYSYYGYQFYNGVFYNNGYMAGANNTPVWCTGIFKMRPFRLNSSSKLLFTFSQAPKASFNYSGTHYFNGFYLISETQLINYLSSQESLTLASWQSGTSQLNQSNVSTLLTYSTKGAATEFSTATSQTFNCSNLGINHTDKQNYYIGIYMLGLANGSYTDRFYLYLTDVKVTY